MPEHLTIAAANNPVPNLIGLVASLIPEYPSQTDAFFWREMQGLAGHARDGTGYVVSTSRPARSACRHDFAARAHETTTYLLTVRSLAAGAVIALAYPRRAARAIRAAWRPAAESAPHRIVASLAAFYLSAWARRTGIDCLHVHSAAASAGVAMIAAWTSGLRYGVAVHGDLEIYGSDNTPIGPTAGGCVVTVSRRPLWPVSA